MIPNDRYQGWSEQHGRVLTSDEWADSYARLGNEMERKYPKQPWLAPVARERGERIREHGLDGAGRPPVEKIVGAMR